MNNGILLFGKHQGKQLSYIQKKDPKYIRDIMKMKADKNSYLEQLQQYLNPVNEKPKRI